MSADLDRIGTVIDGKYELQRLIGRGGMGAVYAARQSQLDRQVAVKLLRPDVTSDERAVARFNREARAAARIEHPNAVRVYDFGATEDGVAFIVMEYVEGVPLRVVMRRTRVLPIDLVLAVIWQAAAGVSAAHAQGIIHRDLKPENLIVHTGDDGAVAVKVVDFGLAKLVEGDTDQITSPAEMIGTPKYMAPEQFSGDPMDARVDVYALGVILFEMLAGRSLFDGTFSEVVGKHLYAEPPTFESLGVQAPDGVEVVVRRALAKRPAERTASVLELARGFARCFGVETPAATSIIASASFTSRDGLAPLDDEETVRPPDTYATQTAGHDEIVTIVRPPEPPGPPPARPSLAPAATPSRRGPLLLAAVGLVALVALVVVGGIAALTALRAERPLAETPARPAATPGSTPRSTPEPSGTYRADDELDGDDDPRLAGVPFYDDGRIVIFAEPDDIVRGAMLEIRRPGAMVAERFALEPNEKGTKWVVKRSALSEPGGLTVEEVVPVRTPVEIVIRNPDGSATRPTVINRVDE